MALSPLVRVLFVVSLGAAGALSACRATQGPRGDALTVVAGGDGGAPIAPAALYDDEKPTGRLVAFKDDAELVAFEERWKEAELAKQRRQIEPRFFQMHGPKDLDGGAPPPAAAEAPSPSPKPAKPALAAPRPAPPAATSAPTTASRAAQGATSDDKASKNKAGTESITNNQHAAVDEGDIVKLHGDHLVVLRRGRIFTLSLQNDKIRQSKMLDAFGPEIDPRGTWYDEMVVEGDHVVVVGFSYQRGGTEVGLFRIDAEGQLTYRATYHLRSNDYYSSRNYASRIVDGRLVFYTPFFVSPHGDLTTRFPAYRHWKKGAQDSDFVRSLSAKNVYHLEGEVPKTGAAALHTVTSCDLREPKFGCESIGVIGPHGRVFYVSPSAVYVWMHEIGGDQKQPSGLVAKLPIGRGRAGVTAVRVAGMPTDQFSFEEDDEGFLDVLVRSEASGDAMFMSERTGGAAALVRLPRALFSDGVPTASPRRYRSVPRPDGYAVQNRFVGPWLLYGAGNGYVTQHRGGGQLYAVRYASSDEPRIIDLDQGIDRIEPMGDDAVVVGARGSDLVFSPIELGSEAHARRDFVRKNASQGELRSHGFFYKPSSSKPREGVVGLPIRSEGARGARYLLEGSASVLFLNHRSLELTELGSLAASPLQTNHDGCRASCVDWYGNARPIFAKNRIFALMGYELVEGRLETFGSVPRLGERARLSFAPRGGPPAASDEWD
ncbi:MAG: beta-propeller domain-containing protein [Labilithrix sp.]|nr:beta-propeller domain-containing protein [Labilithrix sp.]